VQYLLRGVEVAFDLIELTTRPPLDQFFKYVQRNFNTYIQRGYSTATSTDTAVMQYTRLQHIYAAVMQYMPLPAYIRSVDAAETQSRGITRCDGRVINQMIKFLDVSHQEKMILK
jgi:hypothetical protein